MLRRSVRLAVVAALIVPVSALADLPLGPPGLDEETALHEVAPGLTWTSIRRGDGEQRWRVHVLELEAGRELRARTALSNGRVRGREPLRAIVRRSKAVAAVNGGFFATAGQSNGDPVGALVVKGRLASESVDGRPALLLYRDPSRRAQVARLEFKGRVAVGGASRHLDGVNRPAGFIPGCGGRGGDRPTQRPNPVMCTDPSELVLMTRDFGRATPRREGVVEAVVHAGKVEAVRRGGGTTLRKGKRVIVATGGAARFLRDHARRGETIALSARLRGRKGLDLGDVESVVSGDQLLLRRGRRPELPATLRRARTLVGVGSEGQLFLATVDGGARSAGATMRETARVMRSLGARDALALDGGGSTTMFVEDRVVNSPSGGQPRPLSDALVIGP